jgi:hypothetical protein
MKINKKEFGRKLAKLFFVCRLCSNGILLICAPGASLSAGGPGSLLGTKVPAGSPLPLTPAGVFAPSAPINRVPKSIIALTQPKKRI